jgi:hypothetical protein
MALSRDAWYDHLLNGTGPLDPDTVDSLTAEPELMALLRELIALPWPEYEEPERVAENDVPFYAMILVGLLRDAEAVEPMLALASHAVDEEWEAVTEVAPAVLAEIGEPALAPLLAELDRLEREELLDADAIDRDDLDDRELYRYWQLVICVEQIALNHPATRADIARFAAERIATHGYDRSPETIAQHAEEDDGDFFALPMPTEIWVDLQASLRAPELVPLVDDFFARHGDDYVSSIFGTKEQYEELVAGEPLNASARARLLKVYSDLHETGFVDDEDDDDEEDEDEIPIETVVRSEPKVGRNDPCPCGSGKKYKKCHGA